MAKEFHITFSCETNDSNYKSALLRVQKMMKDGGAELISKNDDMDGVMDIVFHKYSYLEEVKTLCSSILNSFKNQSVHLSALAYEHQSRVLLDTKDVKDINLFTEFVKSLSNEYGITLIEKDKKEPTLLNICFEKSSQRQSFQNVYTAKAGSFMKNGHDSVNVFPDWDDITVLQQNNYSDNNKNKSNKFGY
ncbi:hypothetical protein GW796_07950 [archaeon]|nr:hypothetical protein [archaeon]